MHNGSVSAAVIVPFLGPDDHVVMIDCKSGKEVKQGTSHYNEAEALLIMRCGLWTYYLAAEVNLLICLLTSGGHDHPLGSVT